MGSFQIQKAIYVPRSVSVTHVWPFGQMQVGDTFLVSEDSFARARGASRFYVNRYAFKISYRREGKKYRFWRMG